MIRHFIAVLSVLVMVALSGCASPMQNVGAGIGLGAVTGAILGDSRHAAQVGAVIGGTIGAFTPAQRNYGQPQYQQQPYHQYQQPQYQQQYQPQGIPPMVNGRYLVAPGYHCVHWNGPNCVTAHPNNVQQQFAPNYPPTQVGRDGTPCPSHLYPNGGRQVNGRWQCFR